MSIPTFDGILNALPPHLGNPTSQDQLSPYPCTTEELCRFFATSTERKQILKGFLQFRLELRQLGIEGFHWIDGSFSEDIEAQEGRPPADIDVVTYISCPNDVSALDAAFAGKKHLLDRAVVKRTYCVDHYLVPLCSEPKVVVDWTRYWYALFSHRRDSAWKGMLRIELSGASDDTLAHTVLGAVP